MFKQLRGRKGRLVGIVAAIPLALGALVGVASPAAAATAPIKYVAIGDSYTAGQGGGTPLDACLHTTGGYPVHVHNLAAYDLKAFPACVGATTTDVRTRQLAGAPDLSVGLVTLTVGGNDLGFSDLGRVCAVDQAGCAAILTVTPTEAATLFNNLVKTYWAAKAKYPLAKIVVLSYPRLFKSGFSAPGLPVAFSTAVNAGGDVVHQVIVAAAKVSPVTFVDVRDEFRGHEIGTAQPWINFSADPLFTLHPNATGYRYGYFQALVNDRVVPAY